MTFGNRQPTPLERYQRYVDLFTTIRRDIENMSGISELSDTDIEQLSLKLMKSDEDDLAEEKKKVNGYLKVHSPEQLKTQMITISIDQHLDPAEAVNIQFKCIEKIQKARYKFITEASHKFEYWSSEGWNPHIHIVIEKNKTEGQVSQQIRRKLKDVPEVYRVHVSTLNYEAHQKYIKGDKTDKKEEYVKKDEVFREIHNIEDIYYW